MIGQALWQVKPDFAIKDGLEVAFAPGFDVPDAIRRRRQPDDLHLLRRLATTRSDDYSERRAARPRGSRATGKPLLAIMGAEEQIVTTPTQALAAYAKVPGAETELIPGAGHSPNVEKPAQTAALVLKFAKPSSRSLICPPRSDGE